MNEFELMSLSRYQKCLTVSVFVCVSMESDAVLGSHGHPLPHGRLLQRWEGQLREVQTLRHQTLSSARHRTRQGLFLFVPLPLSVPPVSHYSCDSTLLRCESAWFSLVRLLGWSSPWTHTPPKRSWRGTWRKFHTGVFLLISPSEKSCFGMKRALLQCEQEWLIEI